MELHLLLEAASHNLRATVGGAHLSAPDIIKESHRSRTIRCQLSPSRPGANSVILKQLKEDPGCGYSDWASLQFLTELSGSRSLAPRFLGGDKESGFFLLEDLGDAANLQDVFGSGAEEEILATLRTMGTQMGRLHAISYGLGKEFDALRKSLPGAEQVGRYREAVNWLKSRDKLAAWFTELEYTPPAEWEAALKKLADLYARPGEWLAFTHGDPAPSNNHIHDGAVRLLDFEYGGFRHALYDITAWEILCPLPRPWVTGMREAFRAELASAIPAAQDEVEFDRQWAIICGYRALSKLTWINPKVVSQNSSWVGNWTARQAVLSAVSRWSEVAAPHADQAVFAQVSRDLTDLLHQHWPGYSEAELTPKW